MAEGIPPWKFHNTTQSGHRDGGEEGLNHLQMVCARCVAESKTRRGGGGGSAGALSLKQLLVVWKDGIPTLEGGPKSSCDFQVGKCIGGWHVDCVPTI